MSDEENVKGFMDFIGNISQIDDTEKNEEKVLTDGSGCGNIVKKKNENTNLIFLKVMIA